LPAEFADLEPYAAVWCLPTEGERYSRRLASSMDELQDFYDACFPRVEAAIAHCDAHPLDAMPDDVVNLMRLI
jgi:Ser/Thr protein kinase RdoA (MazF antagonist)